ncbi:helix-turn-helix transcriptional regulator [Bacillus sp. Marseille-P3661]|uniref:helix-turn-helix transcriptional regulator n=1 Tax=Bacillus sp. Marseille-P3661 TaxID=1936234 RepID=UPI000C83EEA8|nr:metalloregulator ArsR/SmtB family transcription factor [Bacillus sp. Marseille-P3661]
MIVNSSSTRDEILKMLKFQKKMTVTEMAQQLEITEMAVRRHLNTLEKDRYVETILVRQPMGRPLNIYKLTAAGEELFPRNYKSVALDFIDDINEIGGKAVVDQLFNRRKERMKDRYLDRLEDLSFDEKVRELAQIQNENGYMTKLVKDEDGNYQLYGYNCPIHQVANKYSSPCKAELTLFKEVLETENIKQQSCISNGDNCCNYVIKK